MKNYYENISRKKLKIQSGNEMSYHSSKTPEHLIEQIKLYFNEQAEFNTTNHSIISFKIYPVSQITILPGNSWLSILNGTIKQDKQYSIIDLSIKANNNLRMLSIGYLCAGLLALICYYSGLTVKADTLKAGYIFLLLGPAMYWYQLYANKQLLKKFREFIKHTNYSKQPLHSPLLPQASRLWLSVEFQSDNHKRDACGSKENL
ncbi:MAG: hypothetical protein AAGC65_06050 [Mucilaginibacter sp.]|uniref:hypothetical protein n=1 Tax=Mucilaginibacter sp. TaxID=1882438 RepID=UPI0031B15623